MVIWRNAKVGGGFKEMNLTQQHRITGFLSGVSRVGFASHLFRVLLGDFSHVT